MDRRAYAAFLLFFLACSSAEKQVGIGGVGDERDEDGATPLIRASRAGNSEQVKSLLAQGANANAVDNYRWTALIWACDKGYVEIVKSLIAANADVNHRDTVGATPLIRASARGHSEIVKVLLAAGADPSQKTELGNTALDLAANQEIRSLLSQATKLPQAQ
ncbi:MAG: ankyrin repeat domain-containing protein [Leptospiraceae bacterium]|nr:ankyrin repeat domain-containing protein [Leptospiraceae bacterium]MDW8307357.1 ankyrin repeat domain-containing protein [Leptospiraceae bacterium]